MATAMSPNSHSSQTYLDDVFVQLALEVLTREPDSPEHIYRRVLSGVIYFLFPKGESYDIVQDSDSEYTLADFSILQFLRRPGGSFYQYDFMLIESKKLGESWEITEDQLQNHLAGVKNESKNCYGMIQIGLEVQYYKYEKTVFTKVGEKMHLTTHVHDVIRWGRYIKNHPLPYV